MFVDSHCHLDRLKISKQGYTLEQFLALTKKAGVERLLCVAINLESYPRMLSLAEPFPEISISVGVHPNEPNNKVLTEQKIVDLAGHPKNVAIGETGLDYYRSKGGDEWQQDRFRLHIRAAKACAKPLIIHCREAISDVLVILKEEGARDVGGVFHCFTEDWESAKRVFDLGFLVSFSGIVTYANTQDLQEVARKTPLESMLIETDSPYLAPHPYRGRENQPAYVKYVAETIAELRGCSVKEIAEATTANYFRLFHS